MIVSMVILLICTSDVYRSELLSSCDHMWMKYSIFMQSTFSELHHSFLIDSFLIETSISCLEFYWIFDRFPEKIKFSLNFVKFIDFNRKISRNVNILPEKPTPFHQMSSNCPYSAEIEIPNKHSKRKSPLL